MAFDLKNSPIIRLQGLPAVANSSDIRQFFCGLNIPRGGVYITGGKYGEAYIVFATYEDAQYALSLTGRPLKDSYVRLTYSNEDEMRHALEIYQIGLNPTMGASGGPEKKNLPTFSYLYVRGLPIEATKWDIRQFFKGLLVEDILLFDIRNGYTIRKAIVKFGNETDASKGLIHNYRALRNSPIILKLSNEDEWNSNLEEVVGKRPRSPTQSSGYERQRSRSRSPIGRRRDRYRSPFVHEYYVHLINVSYRAEKIDIKLFFDLYMSDTQITFLVDKEGKRTREAFCMFTTVKEYRKALSLTKETFKGHTITILPISKRDMLELIDRMKVRVCKDCSKSPSRSSQERKYIYLRNFAFDVTKADVRKFFTGQTVKEDDIFLLHNSKGIGLGEALVKFTDEKEASKAEKQSNQTYQGIKVLLSRITEKQMKELKEASQVDETIVYQADDMPDCTSDSVPNMVTSVKTPSVQTNRESSAPDSSEVGTCSDSESVPPLNKESEATSGSDFVLATHSIQNNPTGCPDDTIGFGEESTDNSDKTKNSDVTLLFVRNLPASVTAAEILDFFHDYKVSSVNLKNIKRGVATVRMQNYAEAVSAINCLNNREVGLKQVLLSLM